MVNDARRRKGGVGDSEFLLAGFNMPKGKHSIRLCKRDIQSTDFFNLDPRHIVYLCCILQGLGPLLPIYQRWILYRNTTIQEVTASGLGELIQ